MAAKKGSLSISSENIFPIIKKWVYSDHDIFARELVSNGCDAITKLKKLDMMGEYTLPDDYKGKIQVIVNPEEKTLKFIDNGLGMTADEVDEYINQIAFSGAEAFLEQYKDKTSEDQIIGHFGLGFYSAFMVADRVTIETLSYKKDAKAVLWDCEDGMDFTMSDSDKADRGTKITLYLNDDSVEFANIFKAKEILDKYCSFMPVEIFVSDPSAEPEYQTIMEEELTDKDTVIAVAGGSKKDYLEQSLSQEIEQIMEDKEIYKSDKNNNLSVPIVKNDKSDKKYNSQIVYPIISNGDSIGTVILLSKEASTKMSDVEAKVAQSAASFLGSQMEI